MLVRLTVICSENTSLTHSGSVTSCRVNPIAMVQKAGNNYCLLKQDAIKFPDEKHKFPTGTIKFSADFNK